MDAKELSSQLKKPTGETGLEIARALNDSNRGLYDLAFQLLELKPGQHILEIGFGNGIHFPKYFELQSQLKVHGVDFSRDMCEEARKLNSELINTEKLAVHCAETTSLPFPGNTFDLAVALNVIYFLDPPETHLKEIHRVLKPGGLFLIGYRPRHSVEHMEFTRQNFILYESDELKPLFEHNGFEIIEETVNSYEKLSMDGIRNEIKDACLLVRKI
ncbi:MAG: class I SAM-dependent methyltransferase [Balneolaceae bacterium]